MTAKDTKGMALISTKLSSGRKRFSFTPTKTSLLLLLVMGLVLGLVAIFILRSNLFADDDKLYIAFHAVLSGDQRSAITSKQMLQGIQLYLDEVNQADGINGQDVALLVFDNEARTDVAQQSAQEIAASEASIVLGHFSSNLSLVAGEVYQKVGIPAISSAATADNLVVDNEWFFRVSPGARLYAQFSATYIENILQKSVFGIIYDDQNAHSLSVKRHLEEQYETLGKTIPYQFSVNTREEDSAQKILQLMQRIRETIPPEALGSLFVVLPDAFSSEVVSAAYKQGLDIPIFGLDFDETTLPSDRKFMENIYLASTFLPDAVNADAQMFKQAFHLAYGNQPSQYAVTAYDAARIAVQALQAIQLEGQTQNRDQRRQALHDYLTEFNGSNMPLINGLTGPIFFDQFGDAQRALTVGVYQHPQFVSELTQLQQVMRSEIIDPEIKQTDGNIIPANPGFWHKTNLVQMGISLNEIRDISPNGTTYYLDFNLWFRYTGDIKPEEIIFLNAVEPIELGPPVQETVSNQQTYRLYQVEGQFKAPSLDSFVLGQHTLEINLHHQNLNQHQLVYILDLQGRHLAEQIERKNLNQILAPASGWEIQEISAFQILVEKNILGDPTLLYLPPSSRIFSGLDVEIKLEKTAFIIYNFVSTSQARWMFGVSSLLLLVVILIRQRISISQSIIWSTRLVLSFFILFSGQVFVVNSLVGQIDTQPLLIISNLFYSAWWLLVAFFATSAIYHFLWVPIETTTGRAIPGILRNTLTFIIYTFSCFGIIAFVFDQPITSLLATSGLLLTIIGLAIQVDISNVFAGISLNLERPFRPGDWVRIGDYEEGQVLDVNWRTIRLTTRDKNIVIIPNSTASQAVVENFDYPDNHYWLELEIQIRDDYSHEKVIQALEKALARVEEALDYEVNLLNFGAGEGTYQLATLVQDYGRKIQQQQAIFTQVWTHLDQAGISSDNDILGTIWEDAKKQFRQGGPSSERQAKGINLTGRAMASEIDPLPVEQTGQTETAKTQPSAAGSPSTLGSKMLDMIRAILTSSK